MGQNLFDLLGWAGQIRGHGCRLMLSALQRQSPEIIVYDLIVRIENNLVFLDTFNNEIQLWRMIDE